MSRNIIFDLDGTLVKLNVNWQELKNNLKKEFQLDFNPLFNDYLKLNKEEENKALKIIEKYELESKPKWVLNHDIIDWIKKKYSSWRFFIVTNNTRKTLDSFLDIADIEDKITSSLTLNESKFPKPHKSTILNIMKDFEIKNSEVLFVGDSEIDTQLGEDVKINYFIQEWFTDDVFEKFLLKLNEIKKK